MANTTPARNQDSAGTYLMQAGAELAKPNRKLVIITHFMQL